MDQRKANAQARDSGRSPFSSRSSVGVSRNQTTTRGWRFSGRSARSSAAASTWRMPRSTRSPIVPRSAGSTISEPTSDVKTTMIVPIPIEVKIFDPANSIPAIATRSRTRR